jgi:hypothetical protein
MTSKPVKWLLWTGIIAFLLVSAVSVVAAVVLPGYVENRLLPRLAKEFGLSPADIRVRRIGPWGSDLGPIRLTSDGAPAITIAAVQVDYSPWSLIRGKIKGLTIGGLGVPISWTPDGASIAGIRVPAPSAASESGTGLAALDLGTLLPIELGRLAVVQSHLTLEISHRRYVIPFDIELQTHQLGAGRLKGRADLLVLGNPVALGVSLDQKADTAELELDAAGFQMAGLGQLAPPTLSIQLKGRMDIQGRARFGLRTFELKGLALSGSLSDARLTTPHGSLHPLTDENGRSQPIAVSMTGGGLSELKWRLAPFQISGPVDVAVDGLSGILSHAQGRWTLNGEIKTVVADQSLWDRVHIPSGWDTTWRLTGHGGDTQGLLEFSLTSQESGQLMVAAGDMRLTAKQPAARIAGRIESGFLHVESAVSIKGIQIASPFGTLRIPEVTFDGTAGLPPSDSGEPATVDIKAGLPEIRAETGPTTVRLPETTFEASGKAMPGHPWHIDARLKLSKGRITDEARGLQIRNLSVDLPLKWPEAEGVAPGRLSAGAVEWNQRSIGGVKGTLRQNRQGLMVALKHRSKLFPGMRVLINGGIDRTGTATIEAAVPRHQLAEAVDLGRFQSVAAGMMLSGQVEGAAKFTMDSGRIDSDVRFRFHRGRLHQPARNLILEGVDMQIRIDDIQRIQSAPQQELTVSRVTFGNLKAKNLSVDFQVEPPGTLFVEKAQIDWSQGKVNAAAVRIVPGKDEYDVTLFCDRLNLAMVLEQLGAAEASGEGTVSGSIPIRWTNGRLNFDNGFLYSNSSPGQAATIQLSGTEVLLSGLPPGTPQHTQVDIATEALKDYTYRWARLNLQTEDNILLLKLQFDGKPNRLLPFAYDQQLGQFKRVAGEGQADFKGISIDLNLRSPLNEIMNYKELLK